MNAPDREEGWEELALRGARYRVRPLSSPDYPARVLEALPGRSDPGALFTIHGMEEEWHVFERALEQVKERRILQLDMAWSGRSGYEWALAGPSVVDRLASAFDGAPARPNVLVAHSFGTIVLLHYLQKHTLLGLDALVLIAPFFMFSGERLGWEKMSYLSGQYQRFLEIAVEVRVEKKLEPDIRAGMAEHVRENIGPEGCLEFLHHFVRTRTIDLDRIRVPVLVVCGERDFYARPEDCRHLAEKLPKAELMIVADAGHFSMLERPVEVGTRIDQFLDHHVRTKEVER